MKAMRALCFVSLLFIFLCSAVHAATTTRAVFSILYSPANLFTTQYRYCLLESEAGGTTSTVCPSGREVLVNQNITWGTVIPPGIYPRNSSKVRSVLDVQYACVAYTCDMTSDFAFPIGASVSLGDAYGGFSPATPCCGPAYDTMVFDTEKREIRQMSNLPVETVNAAAERSIQSYACEGSPLPDCHIPTSKFLVKLLNPRMYPMLTTFSGPSGDGGIIFSAGVSICNQSLSTVFSYDTAAVLTVGYNVVLSMAEAVALALPWELIRYVASWIRDQPGGKTALLRSGRCHWGKDEEAVNLYRTGDYLECSLDPTMVGELPVLTLTVVRGSVVWRNFGDGEPSGSFTLDLNRLVSEDGSLRLYSTGSITNAREKRALSLYRDPFIVLGALYVRGAVFGITRNLVSTSYARSADVFRELPLLYIAAPNMATPWEKGSSTAAVCMAPAQCNTEQTYFQSLNTCANVECANSFGYLYHKEDMTCGANPKSVAVFAMLFLLCVAGEGIVVWNRKRARRRERAHIRLVELVQKKIK